MKNRIINTKTFVSQEKFRQKIYSSLKEIEYIEHIYGLAKRRGWEYTLQSQKMNKIEKGIIEDLLREDGES
jgi:ribosomal protein S24E